jgi:hypothetical protein
MCVVNSTGKTLLLIAIAFALIGATFWFIPQWPQDQRYHCFVDDRLWRGVPNAHNVLSNLGILLVGGWGSLLVLGRSGRNATGELWIPYLVFFFGVFLTSFGSAWYHWQPDNHSLVWDRLPMTVMFMGFFTVAIGELISPRAARALLLPLLIIGFTSVIYWIQTEDAQSGDLRLYGLVQFLPPLLVVLMLFLFPRPPGFLSCIVGLLAFFVLAKLFEHYDEAVFQALNEVVAGHAIKHLCAAIAPVFLIVLLQRRKRVQQENDHHVRL